MPSSRSNRRRTSRRRATGEGLASARWWTARRAANRKPATYRCPLCGELLPALSEHMLLMPEGNPRGRRHAHTACVLAARRSGRLLFREDYERASQGPRRPLQRLRAIGSALARRFAR
ncbi:MAG TPA: hypothetical protein VKU89_03815 [Solirubrobacteraceae bacterium]|nr:hypothetical protein [Solirubrobacteraceae bacterium]